MKAAVSRSSSIGARRRQIIGQFLTETIVLPLVGGIIGVTIVFGLYLAVRAVNLDPIVALRHE